MKEIHFFDVDNTLLAGASAVHYLFLGITKGIFPLRPLFAVPGLMLKYRSGGFSIDRFYKDGIPFLSGVNRESLETLAASTFKKRLAKRIYQEGYNLVNALKAADKEVVLATSSFDFVIAPLAAFLGVETTIATSLAFDKTVCTGMFNGQPVFAEEKLRRVKAHIKAKHTTPAECYFYSDSIHDLPLLMEVGHPVAVNPDKLLNSEAGKRGWQLLSFSSKGIR